MRLQRNLVLILVVTAVTMMPSPAGASVILNEIFADPAADLQGDANGDGVRSGTEDEFLEILNYDGAATDISGWYLTDSVSTRHIFSDNTILSPYAFLVIFGGGSPLLTDVNWQTASSGSLSLNNAGDTVSLFNAETQLMDSVVYGSIGGNDQSITLFPDGVGTEFVLHSNLDEAQGTLFSPGTSVSGETSLVFLQEEEPPSNPVVPELPTVLYFSLGWASLLFKRRSRYSEKTSVDLPGSPCHNHDDGLCRAYQIQL